MPLPLPPPIDYTGRDFLSLRQLALDLSDTYVPEWTDKSQSDMGVVLTELCAAMGDSVNFYVDRMAAEMLIDFVTQRPHMVSLMKLIGYTMSPGAAAVVTLSITVSDQAITEETLPPGAAFASSAYTFETTATRIFGYQPLTTNTDGNTDLVFVPNVTNFVVGDTVEIRSNTKAASQATVTQVSTTLSAVRVDVPFAAGYNVADAAILRVKVGLVGTQEGNTIYNEILGSSDGSPGQRFALKRFPVISGSEIITIADDGSIWQRQTSLTSSGPTDRHYTVSYDSTGRLQVEFGDGVNGAIPPLGTNNILATYRIGGSAAPNSLQAGSINRIVNAPPIFEKVVNLASPQGGADAETIDQARTRGPLTVKTNDRAVTAEDYKSFALLVPGVDKASAQASTMGWNAVDLYVVPVGGGLPTQALKDLVKTAVDAKKLEATRVFVVNPIYYPFELDITIRVKANFLAATVQADVQAAVLSFFSLDTVDFSLDIYRSDLTNVLEDVPGVDAIVYNKFTVQPIVTAGQQTGNPTFGPLTVGSLLKAETWTVQFLNPSDTTQFQVSGSVSGIVGTGNLGVLFSVTNVLSFTITAGTQPPVVGDSWTFVTEAYNSQSVVVGANQIPTLGSLVLNAVGGQ